MKLRKEAASIKRHHLVTSRTSLKVKVTWNTFEITNHILDTPSQYDGIFKVRLLVVDSQKVLVTGGP